MGEDAGDERLAAIRGLGAVIVAGEGYRLAVADHFGLDVSGTQAISHLAAYGPMSHSELGRRLGLTSGGVTGLVDRLEQAGVARRAADPTDRRRNRVELTDHAWMMLDHTRTLLGQVVDTLGPEAVPTLVAVLPVLAEGLRHETDQLRALSSRRPTRRTRARPLDL